MADPIRVRLDCPACHFEHGCLDFGSACGGCGGLRHGCNRCGHTWHPFAFTTVGANRSPGASDALVTYSDGCDGEDGCGFYYLDLDHPDEGTAGPFLTLEDACRDALAQGCFGRCRFDPAALVAAEGSEVPRAG